MELKEKVEAALNAALSPAFMDLDNDDGIFGFVVAAKFQRMTALKRQRLIHQALRTEPHQLLPAELRQVVFISTLTPAEAASKGLTPPEPKKVSPKKRAASKPKAGAKS